MYVYISIQGTFPDDVIKEDKRTQKQVPSSHGICVLAKIKQITKCIKKLDADK